jgi:hypothetical protein
VNSGLEHVLFVGTSVFVNATNRSIQNVFVSVCMRAARAQNWTTKRACSIPGAQGVVCRDSLAFGAFGVISGGLRVLCFFGMFSIGRMGA